MLHLQGEQCRRRLGDGVDFDGCGSGAPMVEVAGGVEAAGGAGSKAMGSPKGSAAVCGLRGKG